MKAIVAVDRNWGIGCNGQLLVRIPGDMKYFKANTIHKVVVMGQATFDSLPGRKPLPDRVNIVLSEDRQLSDQDIVICSSLDELDKVLQSYDPDEVYVIGGESVYRQLLPWCSEVLVTKIEASYPADKYFPNLDQLPEWVMIENDEIQSENGVDYRFTRYLRQ